MNQVCISLPGLRLPQRQYGTSKSPFDARRAGNFLPPSRGCAPSPRQVPRPSPRPSSRPSQCPSGPLPTASSSFLRRNYPVQVLGSYLSHRAPCAPAPRYAYILQKNPQPQSVDYTIQRPLSRKQESYWPYEKNHKQTVHHKNKKHQGVHREQLPAKTIRPSTDYDPYGRHNVQ